MLGLGLSATAQWPTIITFDAPGAGTAAGQGTQAPGINPAGAITGFYSDSKNVMHGFLRAPDGTITTFDAPGAGSETVAGFLGTVVAGFLGGQGTYPISINLAGAIAGFYVDSSNAAHGFLRAPDGKFSTVDAPYPYAGTGSGQGTFPSNISPAGVTAGNTVDESSVYHGFVLADGKFTIFEAPDAGRAAGQGTYPEWASCLNPAGAVTGWYVDSEGVGHGFVRAPDGKITEFDGPGAGPGGTWPGSINPAGAIAAAYADSENVMHGLLRAPDGTMTTIDVRGAGTGPWEGTEGWSINPGGAIVGPYIDASGVNHGFLRAPDGGITKFDVSGAGTGSGQGTIPFTDDPAGAITGGYIDDGGVIHGFLRTASLLDILPMR
jgi:hypothetical protein